jgi:DHA1 family multidrug resistance protein-like MFS transporter
LKDTLARCRSFCETYGVLICLGITALFAELAYGILNQSAIPPYVQQIGLTAHIGLIYSVFLVVETVFKSPMGHLGDWLGRRPLIVAGALISSGTAFAMTLVNRLWALLILRAFDGLAAAAIWPTIITAMSGSLSTDRRTTAMSALTVAYIGGLAVGPLIGGIANDTTQSKLTSFYLVSGLFLLTALVAVFLTPRRSKEEMESTGPEARRGFKLSDVILGMIAIPDMMLLAFIAFLSMGLLIPIVKLFAMDEIGMSETGYGGLMFPIALAVAITSLAAGRLGDRWGKARSVRVGLGICALAMWAITMAHRPHELAAAGMLLGIGFVTAMPAWLALVSDMASPWVRGAVVGALGTAQGLGAVVGAYLGSQLYDKVELRFLSLEWNKHYSPFVVSAIALTTCFVLSMAFIRDGDKRRIGAEPG